jgi:hypothetical protein
LRLRRREAAGIRSQRRRRELSHQQVRRWRSPGFRRRAGVGREAAVHGVRVGRAARFYRGAGGLGGGAVLAGHGGLGLWPTAGWAPPGQAAGSERVGSGPRAQSNPV